MFSGIITEVGTIISLDPLHITLQQRENLELGCSIAVNGVCLTVTALTEHGVTFDLSEETKRITTLGRCKVGEHVNLERALCYGVEVGGHLVSGHVCATSQLLSKGNEWTFSCSPKLHAYLFYKGYIALNGVSLTIAELNTDSFKIAFIPETLKRTTFGTMEIGTEINVEWDQLTYAAVETMKRLR